MAERFEHHARLMTVLTLVSRVTGLVRDAALARVFGVGPLMDAFNLAFLIPNLFRRLFGEGAISAAFVPRYAELERDDPAQARRYSGLLLALLAAVLWGIVIVGELFLLSRWLASPPIEFTRTPPMMFAGVMVESMSVSYVRLGYELTALMLPYMPLVCLTAVAGSALQVHGRFGPTAASPIILNIALIAATLGVLPLVHAGGVSAETHLRIVAGAVLVAGVLQLWWTFAALRAVKPVFAPRDPAAWASVRATMVQTLPMMLGLGVLQINTAIDGLIASWPTVVGPTIFGFDYPLATGAMSAMANAQRLYEFPLGVFGISIATAVFPLLARQNNDMAAFAGTVRRALRLTVFIGLPASAGLVVLARDAAGAFFRGGAFDAEDVRRVAFVVIGFAPAIWSYQMNHVFTRAFYALKEPMVPVKVSVAMVVLNLALNVTLIFTPLREAGLAWSTAICSVLQVAILGRLLARRVPGIVDREVLLSWRSTAIAAAVMTVAVLAAERMLPDVDRWSIYTLRLGTGVVVGMAAFFAIAALLGMPEVREVLRRGGRGGAAPPQQP
ncbi:MAG: murein biosynthesis integral membrane protein MurJ [bacterium]|jgi:putative peptidoglycan lipid II flippase